MCKPIMILALALGIASCQNSRQGKEIRLDFNKPANTGIIANGVQWSAYPNADKPDAEKQECGRFGNCS